MLKLNLYAKKYFSDIWWLKLKLARNNKQCWKTSDIKDE